jgi:outer membrane receptor for ferrienterochelin and colicins
VPNHISCAQRAISVTLIFLFSFIPASARSSGEIRGRVNDATGAAITGAAVTLKNLSTGFERVALSDANGEFSFEGVSNGRYSITASARGFAPEIKNVESISDQAVDFSLQPAAIAERLTVTSGSRQEELRESLNTRVDVIGSNRIRDTGYESVAEVLRELPGVLTRRGSETAGAAGEQIQGLDSRQTLVLIDGQPVVGARGIKRGVINLDRQSTARLDRVEVVKGAASALYGSDAIGGVINLITREPSAPIEFGLTVSGGSRGALDTRAEAGFAQNKVSGFFTVERHKNNGFDLTPTTFDTTGAGFHRYDALAKLKYKFTESFSLSALVNSYWNTEAGHAVGELGPQTSLIEDQSQNYGLTGDWQINARISLQARGYFARYDEESSGNLAPPRNTPLPPGNLYERYGKIDATMGALIGSRNFLQVGGEWTTDRYRGANRIRDDGGNKVDIGVFWAQDRISLANRATITLGLRYDNHSIFGDAVSPKAGVNFRVNDQVRLRASYGRGFRAPDLGQLYFRFLNPTNFYQVIGNPNLEPEYANSWQVGGEYTLVNRRARFGVNFFRNDISDLIEAVNLGFIVTPQQLAAIVASEGIDPLFNPQLGRLLFFYKNVSDVVTQGVEMDGDVFLPKGFGVGGAYTYLDAEDEKTNLQLTGRHRHQGNLRVSWERALWGVRANLRGSFYGGWIATRQTLPTGVVEIEGKRFALWDVYGSKRIYKGLEAFGAIDNLTNSKDPNTGVLLPTGSPAPIFRPEVGRTFRAGIRFNWAGERR